MSPPVMPLFLALAILQQFRTSLLSFDFNQCIVFFSNFPTIDISICLKRSKEMFNNTPPTLTIQHRPSTEIRSDNNVSSKWWQNKIPLDELNTHLAPRITVSDLVSSSFNFTVLDIRSHQKYPSLFLSLSFLHVLSTILGRCTQSNPYENIIQCIGLFPFIPSSFHSFTSVHYADSIHVASLKKKDFLTKLEELKGRTHIVIVGDRNDSGVLFANELVRMKIPYVSVLWGGIEALLSEASDLLIFEPL
jgi:hypothetical protein